MISDAARVLRPVLEKYGLTLVSAKKIEYPHILFHVTEDGKLYTRFVLEPRGETLEREIELAMFISRKYTQENE
ncbi:MAG: hypothetical protein QXE01_03650 [Sulfolobales archaeon]